MAVQKYQSGNRPSSQVKRIYSYERTSGGNRLKVAADGQRDIDGPVRCSSFMLKHKPILDKQFFRILDIPTLK
jgi:hypothetical protein